MSCETTYDDVGNELVPLDTLLPKVLTHVPQLPYNLVMSELRSLFIEFTRRTGVLRRELNLQVQKDVTTYPLPIPIGYYLHSVRGVSFGTGRMAEAPSNFRNWGSVCGDYSYYFNGADALVLRQKPSRDSATPITVYVQLVPAHDVDTIPADLAAMYGTAIGAGVAGNAMNSRQKPWYDPGNSVRLSRMFYQAINDCRANTLRNKQGTLYMRAKRWI